MKIASFVVFIWSQFKKDIKMKVLKVSEEESAAVLFGKMGEDLSHNGLDHSRLSFVFKSVALILTI